MITNNRLLEVENLKVRFYTLRGVVHALERVSFHLNRQETLGLAGETGCGKSVTARAILRLIDPPGRIIDGSIRFEGKNLLALDEAGMRKIRGSKISMIMQEPRVSLNPVIRVEKQIAETLLIHNKSLNRRSARSRAVEMLSQVGIPDPAKMARRYPHELSGGMSQRVMIAMMLVTRPKLLIADEPTSALDVTIQAQILELMKSLVREIETSVLMITHDLGVMAEICNRIAVMYAGNIVETGSVRDVLKNPGHPYTQNLLKTVPDNANPDQPLFSIKGNVPSLLIPQTHCVFAPRCQHAFDRCRKEVPPIYIVSGSGTGFVNGSAGGEHQAACFLLDGD